MNDLTKKSINSKLHKKVTYSIFMKMYSFYFLVTVLFLDIFSLWFRFKSIVLIRILKLKTELFIHFKINQD